MFIFSSSLPLRPIYIEIFSTFIPTKHARETYSRFLGRTVGSFKSGDNPIKYYKIIKFNKKDKFGFEKDKFRLKKTKLDLSKTKLDLKRQILTLKRQI